MIYIAIIYIESVPQKTWWGKIFKPTIIPYEYKVSLIEGNDFKEAHIIGNKIIEEIKQSNSKFFSDKKLTLFVLPPKTIEDFKNL